MRIWAVVAFLLAVFVEVPAFAQSTLLPPTFGHSELTIVTSDGGRHVFAVETATTPAQHAYGLMFRRQLPENAGMLFDYGEERTVSMWMKNTYIPLDMLFVHRDGRIANIIERAVPGSLEPLSSDGKVRGVIELNGGTIARLKVRPGDLVIHPIFGS